MGILRNKTLMALVAAVGFVAGIGLIRGNRMAAEESLSEPLRRDTIVESVYGIGTVMANRSFQFRPGIVTTIQNLFVKEGDSVQRGQKLFEMQSSVVISAPFSGTVTSLPVKVGENVFMQTIVLELVDLADRYVTVSLEQRAVVRVRRGQPARLSFENLRETSFDGLVESVYSSADDFLVRIDVRELPPQILPGMTADVAIAIDRHEEALVVPVSAVNEGFVRVRRENGKIVSVPIKTGLVDGSTAEVVSGDIRPGDRLVVPSKSKP